MSASSLRQVERPRRLARQLGVQPRGVGDVGDQPVQPADVLLQDVGQPRRAPSASVTRSRVSTAERIEVSGLRISWATSAAKRSMASIRSDSVVVMSPASGSRSPSSSSRSAMSGQGDGPRALQAAPGRPRGPAAAPAGRSSRLSRKDESRVTSDGDQDEGQQRARWAATIWSTSPASSVSTPSTACTCWIGIETETTRPPFSAGRSAGHGLARQAPGRSRRRAAARGVVGGRASAPEVSRLQRNRTRPACAPAAAAAVSTRSATHVGVGDQVALGVEQPRARCELRDEQRSAGCRWPRRRPAPAPGRPTVAAWSMTLAISSPCGVQAVDARR